MRIELDSKEIEFLLEALNYAEMDYDRRVNDYPEPAREEYYKKFRADKKKMFEKVKEALRSARE